MKKPHSAWLESYRETRMTVDRLRTAGLWIGVIILVSIFAALTVIPWE